MKKLFFTFSLILFFGIGCANNPAPTPEENTPPQENTQQQVEKENELPVVQEQDVAGDKTKFIYFSQFDQTYRFGAEIPVSWKVAYVPEIDALNIYDPKAQGETSLEKSQIFIRTFTASQFLTLSTVEIREREEMTVNGHAAVKYRIEKKPGVADFSFQPNWRNDEHRLIDIRLKNIGESPFYVFAYNPKLSEETFDVFIQSLQFDNDEETFVAPISKAKERITKKPFGLYVTPQDSPVSPEKFLGFHSGVDFEAFADEQDSVVPVTAFCGGPVRDSRTASGYGGLMVQDCLLDHEPITVIYGHVASCEMREDCAFERIGDYVVAGETIAVLGKGESAETGGERKHLHFAVLKGKSSDIRGYVSREGELSGWLDPVETFSGVFE